MMGHFSLAPGQVINHQQQEYVILAIRDLNTLLARSTASGQTDVLRISEIEPARSATPLRNDDLTTVEDKDWETAQKRFDIIRPILQKSKYHRPRREVEARATQFGIHYTTLYEWIGRYERSGKLSALIPMKTGGVGVTRLNKEVEKIIAETLKEEYLTRQRRSVSHVCREVARRCRDQGVEAPHPNTVRNRVAALSEEEKLRKRHGADAAAKHQPLRGSFPGAERPLDVTQIDHTQLDIVLLSDTRRLPIGRPWITLAIDVNSRVVQGYSVSFDEPSAMSVALCLTHAILPKDAWLAEHDIRTSWPCYGIMKKVHVDNGKEFHSMALERACQQYGIDLDYRPVKRPHYGGHIERLMRTFGEEIHALPGTTFSNPQDRGEYDSDKNAALTLSEFERLLACFVTEVYHQRLHKGIHTTPLARYEAGIFGSEETVGVGLPALIPNKERLLLDFMPFEERTIQDYGVVIDHIYYYSDVLRPWMHAKDKDRPREKRGFIFKRDPRDVSVVHFYDPQLQQYFRVPYRNTSRPPMTLWELREVLREVRLDGQNRVDEDLIFAAYAKMRSTIEKAKEETRATRRREARRSTVKKNEQDVGQQRTIQSGFLDEDGEDIFEAFEDREMA